MTVLERSLLESLNLVQPEVEKMAGEIEELTEKLEKVTADQTFWYEAYCRQQVKIKELEAGLENLKEQKKEQDAGTSDSFNNLKEVI
jgi:chromosome segregation ATPase